MKMYHVIEFEFDEEHFGPEGEEYTVPTTRSRRFKSTADRDEFVKLVEENGDTIVDEVQIPLWKHNVLQIGALLYAVSTMAWRSDERINKFYRIMDAAKFDANTSRIASWVDHKGYHYKHRKDTPIYIASEDYEEIVGVSRTFSGILKCWAMYLFWDHQILKVEKIYDIDFEDLAGDICGKEVR